MTVSESSFLFTYGTLMKGFDNPFSARLQESSYFQGLGRIPGKLYRVSWYPGAVYEPQASEKVYGEVYKPHNPTDLFMELDDYEDVSEDEKASLYLRRVVPVTLSNNEILHCWAYLYNQPVAGLELIKNGNFRNMGG
ncbi:hypothetical protein DYBT9275_05251 [Dyadobacter sp. CECT 9275]|uniref:Gamma-glutamylcyclotransferase AIG2-like domain-containing protein n=1 Tax=Dyadobacter helix TaxID=2822344 RepID=A0A916N758_9BACT|nr:gamma-glutamylcyclotransferase family protein [Dyadobacter sp. CECT 9275]CAG5012805.1 hypothetical protein DYBT9275_05251 [Dyadobacter sp. CECT 9275]